MTVESQTGISQTVRLVAGDSEREPLVGGRVTVVISGEPVDVELVVQAEPVAMEEVLPIFQGLSDLFAERGVAQATAEGRTISCRAGCGVCCRQLVPVSEAEARGLARLVQSMPEPQRVHVLARFEAAYEALAPSGVLERVSQPRDAERPRVALEYFRQGVSCPFLENEACSIHPDRPLVCREYLVTSPAENCSALDAAAIEKVKLSGDPSLAVLGAGRGVMPGGWMPLVLALRFVEQAPASPRDRTGPEILRDVFGRL